MHSRKAKNTILPALQITPAMVRLEFKECHVRPSDAEATRWLCRHRQQIEAGLRNGTKEQVRQVLREAVLFEWPEPKFNKMYSTVEDAICSAIHEYERLHHVTEMTSSFMQDEMAAAVHFFRRHRGGLPVKQTLVVEIGFASTGAPCPVPAPEVPFVFELQYENQKVTAHVIKPLAADAAKK